MKSGDHICVSRGGVYDHHGIYVNSRQIIHFSGGPFSDNKEALICYVTPKKFAKGGQIRVIEYNATERLKPRDAVARARGQLGRGGYDLLDRNCEHLATWCVTGSSVSEQVAEKSGWATGLVAGMAIFAAPFVLPEIALGALIAGALGVTAVIGPAIVREFAKHGSDFEG